MVTEAKYATDPISGENICVNAVIGGLKWSVPIDTDNVHYKEILEWVDAGNTITPA